jgi:hypothetical protein
MTAQEKVYAFLDSMSGAKHFSLPYLYNKIRAQYGWQWGKAWLRGTIADWMRDQEAK